MKRIYISVINDLETDQRVHKVARTLCTKGASVCLIGRKLKSSSKYFYREYKTHRLKLIFTKGFLFYTFYNIRLFFFLLFKPKGVLLANDLDTLLANYLISIIRRMPLVYDSHEFFTEVPELIGRDFVRKIWLGLEKWILPKIKYAYTVSSSIANEYKQKYGLEMDVIKNLPFKKEIESEELKYHDSFVLMYQGALNVGRGIELMIDSMQYLDGYELRIAGDGDIADELKERVRASSLESRVKFLGRIPLANLHEETVKADLGLALEENKGLNYYYALPNKLFDYIQAGIPVLASPFPEMKKIVEGYQVGVLFSSNDPKELANKIKEIFSNQEQYYLWQENTEQAAIELCWEKQETELLEIFKKAGLDLA